jgi:hypothetical protein
MGRDTPYWQTPSPPAEVDLNWLGWLQLQPSLDGYFLMYSEGEAQLMLALLDSAESQFNWVDDAIRAGHQLAEPYQTAKTFIETLRFKIMAGVTLDNLVKSNLLLIAAITGRPLDLSTIDLDEYLSQSHDYSQYGLANRLNQPGFVESGNTLTDAIRALDSVAQSNNSALDAIASEVGVSAPWAILRGALIAAFPEGAIPISVGITVIRALVDNNSNAEAELIGIVAALGGSTAGLPD